jgi:putative ABC transport system substrate-binding protein
MLRILAVRLLASLIALSGAPALAQANGAPGPLRVIAYVDADSDRVTAFIARLDAALALRGIKARHRIAIRHVPVDVRNRDETEARIGAVLRDHPALVIASSSEAAMAAKRLTSEVPVVFGSWQDPVRLGLVRSLADPGGNLTGFTNFVPVDMKRLELLREIAPHGRRLGIVIDRWWMEETDGAGILRDAKARYGFEGRTFLVETFADIHRLASPAAREIDAWYVPPTTLPYENPTALVRAIAALGKPAIYPTANFTDEGGLLAYQPTLSRDEALDLFAKISGLVLDGVPPGSIPVERPKSFELSINVATARRLGLVLPVALIKRADRVIDASPVAVAR